MTKKSLASVKAKKNGSFRFGSRVFTINTGRHKAVQTTLSEVAINNLVLRVHLDKPVEKDSKGGVKTAAKGLKTRISSGLTPTPTRQPSARIAERTTKPTDTKAADTEPSDTEPADTNPVDTKPDETKRRSDVTEDTDEVDANPKMIKSKVETPNKPGSVMSSATTPTKVMKYKALNKPGNSTTKYVITKSPSALLESRLSCPTNFSMKVKNTYQAKRKGLLGIRYLLEAPVEKPFEERTLNYKFSKLAVDVRSLRLPAPHWKIKIYMRNKAISSIAFTNKQESERVLKFSSLSESYEMIIDNKRANLLGSPLTIDSRHDVEILLDILHNIELDNPMIVFK